MKRAILFVFSAIAFVTLPSFSLAPAIVNDYHFEEDVSFSYPNPCSGAIMDITGHEEYDVHSVDNGKKVNTSTHASGHYRATDADGNTYVGHWTENLSESSPSSNGALTANLSFKVHFVGQGGVQGFDLIRRGHFTVNANGVITVDRFIDEVQCK